VSDIDTAAVDSLKVLDSKRPIREATGVMRRRNMSQGADSVAKVAKKALWNSILKQRNRGGRAFESVLRLESHS